MWTGGGVKRSKNVADVIYGIPQSQSYESYDTTVVPSHPSKQGRKGSDPDNAEPGRDRRVREAVHGARRRQERLRHRQRSQELSQGNGFYFFRMDKHNVKGCVSILCSLNRDYEGNVNIRLKWADRDTFCQLSP